MRQGLAIVVVIVVIVGTLHLDHQLIPEARKFSEHWNSCSDFWNCAGIYSHKLTTWNHPRGHAFTRGTLLPSSGQSYKYFSITLPSLKMWIYFTRDFIRYTQLLYFNVYFSADYIGSLMCKLWEQGAWCVYV